MIARQVALVPESANISVDVREIARVAAAIQKQVTRDFGPIWEVTATVDGFGTLEDVPNAAGVHLDRLGQPYALIEVGDSWSLTASHETLEMLADPFGNRLVAGNSPVQSQGRVEFLRGVCRRRRRRRAGRRPVGPGRLRPR